MNENKYSEMLTSYLDGELEPAHEPELFEQLAIDGDLQNEMNELLAIRNSVQADNAALTPPVDSTMAIFSAIGFNLPDTAGPKPEKTRPWIAPMLKVAVPVALALLLTWFLASDYLNNRMDNLQEQITELSGTVNGNVNNRAETNAMESSTLPNAPVAPSYPVVSSVETREKPVRSTSAAAIRKNAPAVTAEGNGTSAPETIAKPDQYDNINNASIAESVVDYPGPKHSADPGRTGFNGIAVNTGSLPFGNPNSPYSLYFRGITAGSIVLPYKNLEVGANKFYSNMSAGLYRSFQLSTSAEDIITDIKVGLEAGYEPFVMGYYSKVASAEQTNEYFIKPNLLWSTIALRIDYKSPSWLLGAEPYSQIAVGGTKYGPLVKVQAGLEYDLNSSFGFNLGVEGSSLLFYQEPKWYSAEKLSVVYGMTIKF